MSVGKSFVELLKQIPVRAADLVIKLISVKGIALVMVMWALSGDKITGVEFLIGIGAVLGIRALEKKIGG